MHDQFVGASLGSKLRLDVMNGEVVRFYQLAKSCINPVPCIVPRRVRHFILLFPFIDFRGNF